jgi:hypothetical protein
MWIWTHQIVDWIRLAVCRSYVRLKRGWHVTGDDESMNVEDEFSEFVKIHASSFSVPHCHTPVDSTIYLRQSRA